MMRIDLPRQSRSGRFIGLADVLREIPDNSLFWSMQYLADAIGAAPEGVDWVDLENLVNTSARGYEFSWAELVGFSEGLSDVVDVFLVADVGRVETRYDFDEPDVVDRPPTLIVQMEDSSSWSIWVDEQWDGSAQAASGLRKLAER
ncbi:MULTISPECIES: hypothetical protein [Amycolatopsis]|nr:hypothetical protein [Amycolatopsis sacchari]